MERHVTVLTLNSRGYYVFRLNKKYYHFVGWISAIIDFFVLYRDGVTLVWVLA